MSTKHSSQAAAGQHEARVDLSTQTAVGDEEGTRTVPTSIDFVIKVKASINGEPIRPERFKLVVHLHIDDHEHAHP